MTNPQLTAYIQENLPKFSKEAVIQSLSSAGWSAIDISAAFMELEHPTPPAPIVPPSQKPILSQPATAEPAQARPIGSVEPRPDLAAASAVSMLTQPVSASAPARPAGGSAPSVVPLGNGGVSSAAGGGDSSVSVQAKPPAQATNPNDAFLAEMAKRRKEADALTTQTSSQGDVTISMGSTQSPVVTQTGLVGMVMKTGLVKTEQQANMVLIGVVVVCLGLSLWFIL